MAKGKKVETGKSASSVFKAIDDLLRTPGGNCNTSIDYMEQTSWLLFLRHLDAREGERRDEAKLRGEPYAPVLPKEYAWSTWAYPTKTDGSFDFDKAIKGEDLLAFVKDTLFPELRKLRDTAPSTEFIQYRIGGIFSGLRCLFESGHTLRDVIDLIQPLSFETEEDRHEMTLLYEERLADMGNAGRNGGQYYTPRPLIRTMVRILDPKLGETFYDGACGSGGFITEGFAYMRDHAGNAPGAWETLQHKTFYGQEVKSIPYVTAQMNCILHGLETPNITFGDTLKIKVADFIDADRVDVIAANPPFGANVDESTKQNFVTRSGESAYLFMEHLDLGDVSLGKTRPLKEEDLSEFEALAKGRGKGQEKRSRSTSELNAFCSSYWTVDPSQIDRTTYDLSVKNPNRVEEKPPTVEECRTELKTIFADLAELVKEI